MVKLSRMGRPGHRKLPPYRQPQCRLGHLGGMFLYVYGFGGCRPHRHVRWVRWDGRLSPLELCANHEPDACLSRFRGAFLASLSWSAMSIKLCGPDS